VTSATGRRAREREGRSWSRHRLVGVAAIAYVVATGAGVAMRLVFLGVDVGVPFDHLLHAHSHTLYFGWAALGVLIGAGELVPEPGARLVRTAWALALAIPLILFGFLAFGYNPATIAISTVVMVGWYMAAWFWWQASTGTSGIDSSFFRSAFGYLVAASLGVWVLGFLQASGRGTALSESLSVHAFLLGFAWFLVFGVVGMIFANSARLGMDLNAGRIRRALWWWLPLAFLTFPLGVVGGPEVEGLGPLARGAGLALLYPGWLWASALWKGARTAHNPFIWKMAAGWFAVAAMATGLVAAFGSGFLLLAGRQGIVVYLHVLLVGFVTTSLFALLPRRVPAGWVLVAHNAALSVMLAGLVAAAAGIVETGFWIAAAGAVALWCTGAVWASGLMEQGSE